MTMLNNILRRTGLPLAFALFFGLASCDAPNRSSEEGAGTETEERAPADPADVPADPMQSDTTSMDSDTTSVQNP